MKNCDETGSDVYVYLHFVGYKVKLHVTTKRARNEMTFIGGTLCDESIILPIEWINFCNEKSVGRCANKVIH